MNDKPLLEVKHLSKEFDIREKKFPYKVQKLKAVTDVSLTLEKGMTLGVVGESGCGKSTLGSLIMCLIEPTGGEIWLDGENLTAMSGEELRSRRRKFQIIFQDPYAAFDPRMSIRSILEEPMDACGIPKEEWEKRIERALDLTELPMDALKRYPHEFSGGQRQRISIARTLLVNPELIIADEAVSALDVSIQAQILNLLKDLQKETGTSMIFISHNLASVQYISQKVAVMYLGRIVEISDSASLYEKPLHPYTKALIDTIPVPVPRAGRKRRLLLGEVPSPINLPAGCAFEKRCPYANDKCRAEVPSLSNTAHGHMVACHKYMAEKEAAI